MGRYIGTWIAQGPCFLAGLADAGVAGCRLWGRLRQGLIASTAGPRATSGGSLLRVLTCRRCWFGSEEVWMGDVVGTKAVSGSKHGEY